MIAPVEDLKRCSRCKQDKPSGQFSKDRSKKDGCHSKCRSCNVELVAEWRKKNPEASREYQRWWNQQQKLRDPEAYALRMRNNSIKSKYGLNPEKFLTLWEAQGGRCKACESEMVVGGKTPRSVVVDHDHCCCPGSRSCGQCVRGLLCMRCNRVLGAVEEDSVVLSGLIFYLKEGSCS